MGHKTVLCFAEVLAVQAEIESMKIANIERENHGYSAAYAENAFLGKAQELRTLYRKYQ